MDRGSGVPSSDPSSPWVLGLPQSGQRWVVSPRGLDWSPTAGPGCLRGRERDSFFLDGSESCRVGPGRPDPKVPGTGWEGVEGLTTGLSDTGTLVSFLFDTGGARD